MSYCPKCEKDANCSCSNCKDRIDNEKLTEIYIDKTVGTFKCPYCGYIFSASESEDYEYEKYIRPYLKL